ncbi:NmrA family NAD(P)-binding protein [Rouxiella sp. WC2420]|uniref:NmrA family NAD(P)-binding protein n=1 Tax=Rouxiella sp. WC2420 TaxID=3234145 RepID=A0AB39VJT7_9GAMM
MYVITGITGKVGGVVARQLLKAGKPVRAVIRDATKAPFWQKLGCEIALADMADAKALEAAFLGATAVFILPPSDFDPEPDFPEATKVILAVCDALKAARPQKVVCLSTIGAQATQSNLLTQRTLMEQALSALDLPIAFLRPGWFIENSAFDLDSARSNGVIHSFLQPLDKTVPMVATADVGRVAANLLQEKWTGKRIVELEGPERISPHNLANAFSKILGRTVIAEAVPRENWESLFRSQGAKNPQPRMRMIDGFNEEWITYQGAPAERIIGEVALITVLSEIVNPQH